MNTSLWQKLNRKLPPWVGWLVLLILFGPLVFNFGFVLLKGATFYKRRLPKPNPTQYVFHAPIDLVRNAVPNQDGCPPAPELCVSVYRPSNGTEYDLHQMRLTDSEVYYWLRRPLSYKAEYHLFVTPVSENETRVEVRTQEAQVSIDGMNFGGYVEWVPPTTVEEYRILLKMGDTLGEQGMPPLQLPK